MSACNFSIIFFVVLVFSFPINSYGFLLEDFYEKEKIKVSEDITRYLVKFTNNRGPVVANILEIDLSGSNVTIGVGIMNKNSIGEKSTLLNLVTHNMAFAGVNANYFDKSGHPIGLLVKDGEWLVGPVYNRVAVGIFDDKKVVFDQVMLSAIASVERGIFKKKLLDEKIKIECLNSPPHLCNGISVVKPNWGEELYLDKDYFAYVVKEGCIKRKDIRMVKVPRNGYLIVGSKESKLERLNRWDCLQFSWNSDPDWSGVKEAISGGPYLIKEGEIYIDEEEENIRFKDEDKYAPRTAIGVSKENKLYLITVDGRQPDYSVGLSLVELAEFLSDFGLYNAINLDGGGSTTMVIDGKVVNKPSDKEGEREISNGLLIYVGSGN